MIARALLVALALAGAAAPARGQAATAPTPPAQAVNDASTPLGKLLPALDKPVNASDIAPVPAQAADALEQARKLLDEKRFDAAVELLEKAIRYGPDHPAVNAALGEAYVGANNWAKAGPALRTAAAKAPDSVQLQLLLGQYCLLQGQADQALVHFRRALLCSDAKPSRPDTTEAALRLALALEQQGLHTAALEAYERFGALADQAGDAHYQRPGLRAWLEQPEILLVARGRVLLALDRQAPAADLLERAYRRNKELTDAARLAVRALVATGQGPKARDLVLEMLREPARQVDAAAIVVAGEYVTQMKDPTGPRKLLEACPSPAAELVVAMASLAAELGSNDEAARILTAYVPQTADRSVALRLARLHARAGNVARALGDLATILEGGAPLWQVRREIAPLVRAQDVGAQIGAFATSAEAVSGATRAARLTVAALLADAAGQADQAVALLEQALAAEATFVPAYEELESLHVQRGDLDRLEGLARKIGQTWEQGHPRHYLIGKIQLDRGAAVDAARTLGEAYAADGQHIPTIVALAGAYQARAAQETDPTAAAGDYQDARRLLERACQIDPASLPPVEALYDLHWRLRQPDKAAEVLSRYVRANPREALGGVLLGRHYLRAGAPEAARRQADALMAQAPDDPAVRLLDIEADLPEAIGAEALAADRAAKALTKTAELLRLDPSNLQAQRLEALLLANQGRLEPAAEAFGRLHRLRPRDPAILVAYLEALSKAGKTAQALDLVEQLAPTAQGTPMRLALLEAMGRMQRQEQAVVLLERWMERPTDRRELEALRLRAIELYRDAKLYDKAHRVLDAVISEVPTGRAGERTLQALRMQKLRLYIAAGTPEPAVAYAGQWLANVEEGGDLRGLQMVLLGVCRDEGAYEPALKLVDQFLAVPDPSLPQALRDSHHDRLRMQKVLLLAEAGKGEEAVKLAEAWLAEKPLPTGAATAPADDPPPLDPRRAILMALERSDKADQAVARARQWDQDRPDDKATKRLLADALHLAGQADESMKVLEKVHQMDPDDPGTCNDLGYFWADRGIRLDEAEALVRKAFAHDTTSITVADSFGWVLYKQGRFAEARRVFDAILAQPGEPVHGIILDHAADVYYRLGLRDRASALWARAVEEARKDKRPGPDEKQVIDKTPAKIEAVRSGRTPAVAPLGQGIDETHP